MFSVGDNVEIVENIAYDDYACDDLIGAVGTVIDVNFDEPENVNGILNAKFCIMARATGANGGKHNGCCEVY